MNVTWIVDRFLLNYEILSAFSRTFEDLDIAYHLVEFQPESDKNEDIPFGIDDVLVFYGTLGYLQRAKQAGYKGIYDLDTTMLELFHHCKDLPLLNSNAEVFSVEHFCHHYSEILGDREKVFMRPIKDGKLFPGCIYDLKRMSYLHERLRENRYSEEILVEIPDEIIKEFRLIISEGKVIAGSQYKLFDILYLRVEDEIDSEQWKLAERMASHLWQPAKCYTCDIAELKDGSFKIIEINGFFGAGLYSCDKHKVVEAISKLRLNDK